MNELINGWKDASKELPEFNDQVVVQDKTGNVFMASLWAIGETQEGKFERWYRFDSSENITNIVLWQKKPEAIESFINQ